MSFAHLTIATRDVLRTAAFFERAFGWTRVDTPGNTPEDLRAAWLQLAPGQQIHILHVDGFQPSPFEAEFGRHVAVFHPPTSPP